jgi:ketosteroid isomerase-like protein
VERDGVMRWVAEYERAWRNADVAGVARLFTEDARYRRSPYS